MKLLNKLAAAFISGALVIGVGVAIVSNEGFAKEPSAVKAATVGSTYTEGDAVTSSTFDANASYVLKSTNGYYYTGSVSSKWGLTSNSFASAAVITVSGTATSFNAVDTVSNKQIKAVKSNFQLDATGTNLTLGDATVNGKTYSCVQAKGFYLKCNTGSQNKFRFYDSSSYTTTMLPVQLVKLVSGSTTVNVTGVSLNKTELSLTLGVNEEETLTATVAPEDATNKNVSWKTSDGSVATVNNGKVKAVGEGTATITVTTEDGSKTASCEVTVNPAPVVYATGISLSIADTIHTLDSNDTITLVKDSENGTAVIEFNVEVSPSDSTNKGYSWSCNATDNSVITYTDEPNIAVDTSKEGNYTLTVIASGSETTGAVNKTIYIKVEESNIPTLESVSVSGTPLKETQYVGDAFDYSGLTFTAHYSDNSTQSVDGGDIIWDALVAGENPTGTYNDVTVTVSSVTVVQGAFSDIANIGGTTQYISATENGSTYYLKTNGTKAPLATTNKGEATPFTVTLVANDTYQFENGGQYLYCTNANDGIRFGPSTNVNWIVTGPTTNKTGSFTVMNTATNRYLSLYNFQDFRSYNSATATNRHVNQLQV